MILLIKQPLTVRGITLRNRLVMAPMATHMCTDEGCVTDKLCSYMRARSSSCALGMIITEHAFVDPQGRHLKAQLDASTNRAIPGLAQLARSIHTARTSGSSEYNTGTAALLQISHAGSMAQPANLAAGVVGPSPIIHPGDGRHGMTSLVPQELSTSQISYIVEEFADAALRAVKAGFDGIEVHAAHGYLLDEFYSPLTNKRTDKYGCVSVENRARFTCEVVEAVRATLGNDHILAVRIGPCDYVAGGATVEDGVVLAKLIERAGADILDVSGGIYNFGVHAMRPPGFFRDASKAIRKSVSADVPVITTGGIRTITEAETLLQDGSADLIGIGRALMRHPKWAAQELADE